MINYGFKYYPDTDQLIIQTPNGNQNVKGDDVRAVLASMATVEDKLPLYMGDEKREIDNEN